MAKLLHVWGPTAVSQNIFGVYWRFFGIDTNGKVRAWNLNFDAEKRRFQAASVEPKITKHIEHQISQLRDVQQSKPLDGRITDILRSRLSREEFAKATAVAIQRNSRG